MALEIGGAAGWVKQDAATNKTQAGFDVLTRTGDKTEQMQVNEKQRLEIAEQTGKGLNLDVRA